MFDVNISMFCLILISQSQILKTEPVFSENSIAKADNIVLYENIPLNTEILIVTASTNKEAYPINYSLIDSNGFFKINATTGSVSLSSPFYRQTKYQFTIVATDNGPIKQSAYLIANIVVISANTQAPFFNDDSGYFISVHEIIPAESIIYDSIYLNDSNSEQNGAPRIFCDNTDLNNSDAAESCNYFKIDFRIKDVGFYQCIVTLTKKLDYLVKRNFVVSITAEISMKKVTTYLIVEINQELEPKFSLSNYLYVISYENLFNNTLETKVLNVNLVKSQNISFTLSDPKNYFKLSSFWCSNKICYQNIELKNLVNIKTSYKMNITFNQIINSHIILASAEINVVFDHHQTAQKPPVFEFQEYTFYIFENMAPNTLIRNASVKVFEDESLSIYYSGFYLEVLDENNIFDLEPNNGMGTLISCLKLNQDKHLDHEAGSTIFNLRIKAISRSNISLFSYANVKIFIQDYNEYSPYFDHLIVTKILHDPENLNPGDYITTLKANDQDSNDKQNGLVYNLIGAHQHKFTIDSYGQLRLFKKFDFKNDPQRLYNITIIAYDQGGLSNLTHLVLYLNVSSLGNMDKKNFFCSSFYSRAELSLIDFKTLQPELYIPINSDFKLKYTISESMPRLDELDINSTNGRIFLKSPINSTILNKYARVVLHIQAYQVQDIDELNDSVYFSSIKCMAIIYLKSFDQTFIYDQRPVFLRKYKIQIEKEQVKKSVPIMKIEAISMNPSNNLPIEYTLINENQRIFYIDSIQGFVFLLDNANLENKIYELSIKARDQSNGLYSTTKVVISIVQKFQSLLKCSEDYVLARIDPDTFSSQNFITQINCSTGNSKINNSKITFDISSVQKIYDCEGFEINYEPSIGIDSSNGRILSFKNLNRRDFCDASFTIFVQQDDNSISIPFKLILTRDLASKPPIFIQNYINITYLSEYVHPGSYITTITAYDPISFQLIEKYSIVSENSYPKSLNRYFRIDSLTGVISLNRLPFVNKVEITISATSNNGFISYATVLIDLYYFYANFFSNLYLDTKFLFDNITLLEEKFYYNSIYKAKTRCFSRYDLSKHVSCGKVEYSLDYIEDDQSKNLFLISNKTGYIYLSSPKIGHLNRSEYVLIISAKSELDIIKDRFIREDQRQLKIFTKSSLSEIPTLDKENYTIKLYQNISNNSIILTIKYKWKSNQPLKISLGQKSNQLIEKYFYLKNLPLFGQIQLLVKNTPILFDSPIIKFEIWISDLHQTLKRIPIDVSIHSESIQFKYPIFKFPNRAGYVLDLDPSLIGILNNTSILDFDVLDIHNQMINLSILNKNNLPFYLYNRSLRIIYPFPDYVDLEKKNYLLFIEARNQNLKQNFITVDIRVKSLVDNLPRFERDKTSGPISLSIYENASLYQSILDLNKLVYIPNEKFYFYVFDKETNKISEAFGVNTTGNFWLQPIQKLNAKLLDIYKLFIYVTETSTDSLSFHDPSNLNRALLFVNLKILKVNQTIVKFSQHYSKYIALDPIVYLNKKIGQVMAESSIAEPTYDLVECNLVSDSLIFVDPQFCELFILNKKTGVISTNSSNYQTFVNNYFVLNIMATFLNVMTSTEVYVFIVESNFKSRFVLSDIFMSPSFSLSFFKDDINRILARESNDTLRFEYLSYFISFQTSSDFWLNACFFLIREVEKKILDFEESQSILSSSDSLKKYLKTYSISNFEKCRGEQDLILDEKYYQENSLWSLNSFSIGIFVLTSLILLASILSICLLEICWSSFLRQSMLAVTTDSDSLDANSNNFLIDE